MNKINNNNYVNSKNLIMKFWIPIKLKNENDTILFDNNIKKNKLLPIKNKRN